MARDAATCEHPTMEGVGDTIEAAGSSRVRLLARVIFGLTILAVAVGTWLSFLDAQAQGFGLLPFFLFPILRVHPRDPSAGQRRELAHARDRRGPRPERVDDLVRELRDPRRCRGCRSGRGRGGGRPADVDTDRGDPGHVPPPHLPGGAAAVPAVALVRRDPRGQHVDRLPCDPAGAGEDDGELLSRPAEPSRCDPCSRSPPSPSSCSRSV